MAEIGSVIDSKYEILKQIGSGGMSKVYLAMDIKLNKQWAVKEIVKNVEDKHLDIYIKSAMDEANMMKKLDHPCLPRIVDIIDNTESIYVIMDYIEGEPLSEVLNRKEKIPQELVIKWAKELCDVLDYLHTQSKPIIYRDMKPSNIILQPNGNIKLIDFGIAREYKEENINDTTNLGTRGYAAPEQFASGMQSDIRTDIYGLGVTMYHLVTGKNPCEPPYEIHPIRYWDNELSTGLESIILKCTRPNPEDRFDSCAELLYMLNHYEQMDNSYLKRLKIKIAVFLISIFLMMAGFFTGIFYKKLRIDYENSDYESKINAAKHAINYNDRVDDYLKAIQIKPDDPEAYLGMTDLFKEETQFTLDEEKLLLKCVNDNYGSLCKNNNYPMLVFEIGKMYWNYYTYGKSAENDDNQITRIVSSVQWFDDVCKLLNKEDDNYRIANIYSKIGHFNKEINLKVIEADDKGIYGEYFYVLKELLLEVGNENSEIVKLESYKLCINSIELYSKKFKSDGISYNDISSIYKEIEEEISGLFPTTDKTKTMKTELEARMKKSYTAIENAYMKGGR